jgi:meiosis-specific transcription factor NDT80
MERHFQTYPQNTTAYHSNSMRTLPNASYGSGLPGYDRFPPGQYHHAHNPTLAEGLSAKPEGPPFTKTVTKLSILDIHRHEVKPDISASIQKGFFQVDGKWTCYRRNYFTVACSFTLKPSASDNRYYLLIHDTPHAIDQFAVSISAKTAPANNQDSEPRGLVQHTPKRDKATEKIPERHPVSPAPAQGFPQHHSHLGAFGGMLPHPTQMGVMSGYNNFDSQNPSSPPYLHTFERIQFQKATANNGKRRAQQQYFHVVVELSARITTSRGQEWEIVATKDSDPMVVRGRSPGHYKDGNTRRNSQTSMDPDGHSGPGSEGSGGQFYPHHSNHHHSMDWSGRYGGHHNSHHHQHGREHSYRSAFVSNASPPSAGSSTTLTESPTDTEFALSEADTLKSPLYVLEHSNLAPGSDMSEESLFGITRSPMSRKRPLEEDSLDGGSPFRCSPGFGDGSSTSTFEIPGLASSKMLCAS